MVTVAVNIGDDGEGYRLVGVVDGETIPAPEAHGALLDAGALVRRLADSAVERSIAQIDRWLEQTDGGL